MSESETFPGHENVEAYCKSVLQATFKCAMVSNRFDTSLFEYYNTFKGFRDAMTKEKNTALSLIAGLISAQKMGGGFVHLDVDEQLDFLKEVNSSILENVSYLLDETDGEKKPDVELVTVRKPYAPINTSWNKKKSASDKTPEKFTLLGGKNISRPQFSFKDKVDNSNTVFMPIIKEKPNSIKPLAVFLEKDEEGEDEFCHPYECELEKFQPSSDQFVICEPMEPPPIEKTPFTYVDTPDQLKLLCEELRGLKEFALDLEHHSYRTFQGITCLMQISTREKDFLIDGIALRSDLWILNEVFTDPKIIKVLHGADMDILWLQRDFGLYIVNMFDTGQAARVLNFAHLSLAFLMKHYCDHELDKQYQLADWRIRPLPVALQKYAREDTHYLLYVFDLMKNELLKKGNQFHNLLHSVFDRSKAVCQKKYKKFIFNDERYLELYKKSKKHFNTRQLFCLKELYAWRDKIARVEDESCGYVLPNHMLLQICETLPREHQGILACCNPVPPFVQQQLHNMHDIVSKSVDTPLVQLSDHQEVVRPSENLSSVDLNSILYCPHDIHSYDDNRTHMHQLPETPSKQESSNTLIVPIKRKTVLWFEDNVNCTDENTALQQIVENISRENKTTYERYLLTKKYHAAVDPGEDEKMTIEKQKEFKEVVEPQKERTEAAAIPEQEVITIDDDDSSEIEIEAVQVGTPIMMKQQLTKAQRRRRQKEKRKLEASFGSSSMEDGRPSKKSKTPEQRSHNNDGSFRPFDYNNAHANWPKASPKNANSSNQNNSHGNQHPKSAFRHQKKNRGKQGSFNPMGKRPRSNVRNWPKKQ